MEHFKSYASKLSLHLFRQIMALHKMLPFRPAKEYLSFIPEQHQGLTGSELEMTRFHPFKSTVTWTLTVEAGH